MSPPNTRFAVVDGSGTRTWALHDALGSVRQTLDDTGDPLSPTGYAYTPFGVVRSGAEPAPFGFTGELHSDDLVYLRARWYDPASGTFLGRDPFAGFPTRPYSLHPYQYAYSDPIRYTDPSGRCTPQWVPGGTAGCDIDWEAIRQGRGQIDWQGGGAYAWDVFEGIGLPGAMAVDALAGTNGTARILGEGGTGTYLGMAFTGVATAGGLQTGGVLSNAALRGQVWLSTSTSWLATAAQVGFVGLNFVDETTLMVLAALGNCDAAGELQALQQMGALDGPLPLFDVAAASGMLFLPGRRFDPYDALRIRRELESLFPGDVTSTTVPSHGDRMVHMAGKRHPDTDVVFDYRGFPIFDDIAAYDTRIPRNVAEIVDAEAHMRAATRDLRNAIHQGMPHSFNERQLQAIEGGRARIPGFTWHHHQDFSRMQLVPQDFHRATGHLGGFEMWFGR